MFNEANRVTADTFPSQNQLQRIFHEEDVTNLLNLIKNRLIQAKRTNQPARVNQPELIAYTENIREEVRNILRNKGYVIVDVEAANGETGWRIPF